MLTPNAFIENMLDGFRNGRSRTQLTLGQLIESLRKMPPDTKISPALTRPHSYRGYYSDLSFMAKEEGEATTAAELLEKCEVALGATFCGYKGGDYFMGPESPLWIAEYGCCGERIMSIGQDGKIETKPEE